MIIDLFGVSLSTGVVAAVLLVLSPLVGRRYAAKWRYWIWVVIALRLIIPVSFSEIAEKLPDKPAEIEAAQPEQMIEPERQFRRIVIMLPSQIAEPIAEPEPPEPALPESVSEPEAPKEKAGITPIGIIAAVWAAGAAIYLVIHAVSYFGFRHQIASRAKALTDGPAAEAFEAAKSEMGVGKRIRLVEFAGAPSPLLIGFLRPVLVLPEENFDGEQLYFIVRHELTHYRRRDVWLKLLFVLAGAIHWFNPVVWIMQRQAAVDMELACDDAVIDREDFEKKKAYSETLFSTVSRRYNVKCVLSTQFYGGKKIMKKRFSNILGKLNKKNGIVILTAAVLLIVGMGALVGCAIKEEPSEQLAENQPAVEQDHQIGEPEADDAQTPENAGAPETEPAETEPEDLDDEELRYDVTSVELIYGVLQRSSVMLKNSEINTILDAFSKFDFVESTGDDLKNLEVLLGPLPILRITAEEGVRDLEISFSESVHTGDSFVLMVYPLNEPHTMEGRINLKYYDLYDQFEALDDETRETILSYIDRAYNLIDDPVKYSVPESSRNNNTDSNVGGQRDDIGPLTALPEDSDEILKRINTGLTALREVHSLINGAVFTGDVGHTDLSVKKSGTTYYEMTDIKSMAELETLVGEVYSSNTAEKRLKDCKSMFVEEDGKLYREDGKVMGAESDLIYALPAYSAEEHYSEAGRYYTVNCPSADGNGTVVLTLTDIGSEPNDGYSAMGLRIESVRRLALDPLLEQTNRIIDGLIDNLRLVNNIVYTGFAKYEPDIYTDEEGLEYFKLADVSSMAEVEELVRSVYTEEMTEHILSIFSSLFLEREDGLYRLDGYAQGNEFETPAYGAVLMSSDEIIAYCRHDMVDYDYMLDLKRENGEWRVDKAEMIESPLFSLQTDYDDIPDIPGDGVSTNRELNAKGLDEGIFDMLDLNKEETVFGYLLLRGVRTDSVNHPDILFANDAKLCITADYGQTCKEYSIDGLFKEGELADGYKFLRHLVGDYSIRSYNIEKDGRSLDVVLLQYYDKIGNISVDEDVPSFNESYDYPTGSEHVATIFFALVQDSYTFDYDLVPLSGRMTGSGVVLYPCDDEDSVFVGYPSDLAEYTAGSLREFGLGEVYNFDFDAILGEE